MQIIWNLWKTQKIFDENSERDLAMCRDRDTPAAVASLDLLRKRQKEIEVAGEVMRFQESIDSRNAAFHHHADIDRFMLQYTPSTYGVMTRFKMLVLLGETLQGKASKGISFFGTKKTLKLACGVPQRSSPVPRHPGPEQDQGHLV